jgi:hypothetical protein
MVRVTFPQVLERHVECPPLDVVGATVRQALDAAFVQLPLVRGYLLDDGASLRAHIAVFVDGAPVRDRKNLSEPVRPDSHIHVLQALSGG